MSRRILVVEDSRTQAERLKAVLEDGGYEVDVARDGRAGLAAVEKRAPDAIVSDIVMPGMDGYELCRQVKEGSHRHVPVLLLTSLADPTDIIRALECGADNFLRKPYDPRYLLERLGVLFTTREIRAKDRVRFGMKVMFLGREVTINAEHQQVLDLLISTFEEAVIQNRELRQREEELRLAKAELDRYAGDLEKRLRSVLDTIPDVLFSVDASFGNLFFISSAAHHVFGHTPEELLADPELWRRSLHPDDLPALLSAFDRAIESKLPQTVECRFIAREGGWSWIQLSVAAVSDEARGGMRLDGVARDVTRRHNAEEARSQAAAALQASEERFRGVYKNTTIGLYRTTPDGRILMANPALVRMLGFATFEELARRNLEADGYEPAYPRADFRRRLEREEVVTGLESAWTRADGTTVWVLESARVVRDGAGKALYYDGTVEDITQRKRAEADLILKNVILSTQQETSLDGILVVDEQGQILSWNQRFIELWALPPEVAGLKSDQRAMEAVLGKLEDPEGFVARVKWLYEHREARSEEEIALRDGRTFDRYSAPMFGSDGRYYGRVWYFRDITSRKNAERELRVSEARLQSLFGGVDDALFVHDTEGRIIDCNEAACRRLGYSRDELLAMHTSDVDDPDFAAGFQHRLGRQLGEGRVTLEGLHVAKDGRRIPVDIHTTVIDYRGTKAVLALMRDITERKRAEEALRRSEADFRGLVEHAPLGIYRSTPDGRFVTVNRALVTMLGYASPDELLRLSVPRDVYSDPEERARLVAQVARGNEAKLEAEWKRKDGTLVTVRLNVRLVRSESGQIECFEGLVEDVTEQRSLEKQFRQAQRMEAVGRLAGGVAHDFNNVLTAITGYSELLLDELKPGDHKREDVAEIRAAAQRAAGLTRQLLAFSRKQVLQTRVLDLNSVIRTLGKMLQRLIGEDVKLEVSLSPALGAVRADPGQLEQVILNLAVNSRDAMPGGGRLTIETANVDLDEAYTRVHTGALPGRYVMLAVSDTGIGMDAETQSHIFEPFFTTKEQSTGTGLGLATVYGIVKQSGGYVWVYSEPGGGATFKIYLPLAEAPAEAPDLAPDAQPAAGGSETVLVAEDDPSVRTIVAEVLTQKGYRVLRAPDGQTALEVARAEAGPIQLLVTDLVMPGMTGRELVEALTRHRLHLRVLYMSGYTDDAVVRHGVLEEGMPYLQKPFTPQALASKVRDVLDQVNVATPF